MEQEENTKGSDLTVERSSEDLTRIQKEANDSTVIVGSRKSPDAKSVQGHVSVSPVSKSSPGEETVFQKQPRKKETVNKTRVNKVKVNKNLPPELSENVDGDRTQFKPRQERTRIARPVVPLETVETQSESLREDVNSNTSKNNELAASGEPDGSMILKKRFILEKVLGAGGMGVVYKARDLVKVEAGDKDPYVAIKVLTEEFKEHPEAFVALQRESRKTQRIAHPNIVNVHDFDKDKSTVFMTMEFLEGKPLDQLIRQYKSTGLPTDDALSIIESVCQALIYAHGQKIIHSDFKPGNIFVTDRGVTKVFDFGIARAVAKAEQYEDNPEDRTIFDAGDLGALTPAYASLEMLNGQEPDIRDDIYALGCVAYELFTGRHPFNKIPADEAQKQKLKPKRISNISRRQWKAIQKALSFQRENRLSSAEEFLSLMSKQKGAAKWPVTLLLLGVIAVLGYYQYYGASETSFDETEIRSELEFKLRFENFQKDIDVLIASRLFTQRWEDELWKNVQDIKVLLKSGQLILDSSSNREFELLVENSTAWFQQTRKNAYEIYLEQIKNSIEQKEFKTALNLIENAQRYTLDFSELEVQKNSVQALVKKAENAAEAEKLAKMLEEQKNQEKALVAQQEKKKKQVKEQKYQEFSAALANVNSQIRCESNRLDMRNLGTAIDKLKSIDSRQYKKNEREIIASLSACIAKIGKTFPERASEFKASALKIFNNSTQIAAIQIIPKDPCSPALAGLGARGKRAICKDSIKGYGTGPDLVVIPAGKGIKSFAIGKYEISAADFSLFCSSTKSCSDIPEQDKNLPVANVSIKIVEKYLQWLSDKTGKNYRLPTLKEWEYAAKSTRVKLDTNRNCKLNTRGISKGDNFVRTTVGAQNAWGLVNYVGNASEWVYASGKQLIAIGGAFNVSMDSCDISTRSRHSGEGDNFTGFRVAREINN
ncbi:bifunctional serine/threonine-protein kinase/formylglycine-generating enzyme family protein [Aliikangiella sp. G2MR2-5]|uniref:bifunctional serine/threonine-protein kinase/formylglycine-generating enzyme family protein n=1 Tax=Aliikangiella sp. G2MR2-5 TaxID=2788943 RepID=UPI0018AA156F|nr:bifunctional serine/threonine-protein kinase/formylglycine-generating enzyme family protein [Aliikangiella sp. G2MR2-5]